jgi:hypothetical protein
VSAEAAKEGNVAGRLVWIVCEFRKDGDIGCKPLVGNSMSKSKPSTSTS